MSHHHLHDPEVRHRGRDDDYSEHWWFLPVLMILAVIAAASLTTFRSEAGLAAADPAGPDQSGLLFDGAPAPDAGPAFAADRYSVPDAGDVVMASTAEEYDHAPTF